jgi:putative spermidine/putrescine transport system substrate-binding protein
MVTWSRPAHARLVPGTAALLAVAVAAAACGSPPPPSKSGDTGGAAAKATSAVALGGMGKLVAAAKKEGKLNVIALPPDWANYGAMIKGFQAKYGITVTSAQPDASSQDEMTAAKQLKGTERAPDVFDLGSAVALANTGMFASYKVAAWNDIPANLRDPGGKWVGDYGGFMAIGYDAKKVPAPSGVDDLLKPAYKGKVALNGDPTQAGAGFAGVQMAAVARGGSPSNVKPGVDFFAALKKAGNFLPVDPTPATISSGQTPVVIDWDYTNAAQTDALKGKVDWKVVVPGKSVIASYYSQAINGQAPHPAAARLWQEYVMSNEGQNTYLKGYARPVRIDDMKKDGKLDMAALGKLPKVSGTPVQPTEKQSATATAYLAKHWSKAVG